MAKGFSMSDSAGAHHFRLVKSITLSHTYYRAATLPLIFLMRSSSTRIRRTARSSRKPVIRLRIRC